jgi:hypothetical protein
METLLSTFGYPPHCQQCRQAASKDSSTTVAPERGFDGAFKDYVICWKFASLAGPCRFVPPLSGSGIRGLFEAIFDDS